MHRCFLTTVLVILLVSAVTAGTQERTYRSTRGQPIDAVTLSAAQKTKIASIDKAYGKKLDSLTKTNPQDIVDKRDSLNRQYTKALLAAMSKTQQIAYLEAVYTHVQSLLRDHPGVRFEDVFVWGGAYAKKPIKRR